MASTSVDVSISIAKVEDEGANAASCLSLFGMGEGEVIKGPLPWTFSL